MSNPLFPSYNPQKHIRRDILLPRLYPMEIIREVLKDMNLFIAPVFVRKGKK